MRGVITWRQPYNNKKARQKPGSYYLYSSTIARTRAVLA